MRLPLRGIPFWANLYQTLQISAIFAAVSLHFKTENGEIWRECTDPGHPLPPYFCKKNRSGGFVPWEKFLPKIRHFREF